MQHTTQWREILLNKQKKTILFSPHLAGETQSATLLDHTSVDLALRHKTNGPFFVCAFLEILLVKSKEISNTRPSHYRQKKKKREDTVFHFVSVWHMHSKPNHGSHVRIIVEKEKIEQRRWLLFYVCFWEVHSDENNHKDDESLDNNKEKRPIKKKKKKSLKKEASW